MKEFENIEELNRYYYSLIEELSFNSQNFSDKNIKMFEKNILDSYKNQAVKIMSDDCFYSKYMIKKIRYERRKFINNYKLKKRKFLKLCKFDKKERNVNFRKFIKQRKQEQYKQFKDNLIQKLKQFFKKTKK